MIYLVIIVLIAAAAITRLWLQQRRERQSLSTVDSFWDGLEKISMPVESWADLEPETPAVTAAEKPAPPPRKRRPATSRARSEIDPERRAAAKARLEARRRSSRRAV